MGRYAGQGLNTSPPPQDATALALGWPLSDTFQAKTIRASFGCAPRPCVSGDAPAHYHQPAMPHQPVGGGPGSGTRQPPCAIRVNGRDSTRPHRTAAACPLQGRGGPAASRPVHLPSRLSPLHARAGPTPERGGARLARATPPRRPCRQRGCATTQTVPTKEETVPLQRPCHRGSTALDTSTLEAGGRAQLY